MNDLAKLMFVASQFLDSSLKPFRAHPGWEKDAFHRLSYRKLSCDEVKEAMGRSELCIETMLPELEVEAIIIQKGGGIPPHLHNISESVVVCFDTRQSGDLAYFDGPGPKCWHPIHNRQCFVIPKGQVHGFCSMYGDLWLLAVSTPPIGDDDITYIE